jgi:hypothetical protein
MSTEVRQRTLEELYSVLAIEASRRNLNWLAGVFTEFAMVPPQEDRAFARLSQKKRDLIVAVLELLQAGECQVEGHTVPLVPYPGCPLLGENVDMSEARVHAAIDVETDGCVHHPWATQRWSSYVRLKQLCPNSRVQVIRRFTGSQRGRTILVTTSRVAAVIAPLDVVYLLRWVVSLRINHVLVVSGREYEPPDATVCNNPPTALVAHTVGFSAFARDYLRELFANDPLPDEPYRWETSAARADKRRPRCGCIGIQRRLANPHNDNEYDIPEFLKNVSD